MTRTRITFRRSLLGALVAALLVPAAALAAPRHASSNRIGSHHLRTAAGAPAFAFGGQPVIPMHPFTITIYTDGIVKSDTGSPMKLKGRLNADLRGVLKLAEAEGFFSMPQKITGTGLNVDNGPRFVTVYTANGAKTVTMYPTARNEAFNQLWGTLAEMVEITQ
jgi:hypothetical protein